jgi:hypothetical protein
MVNVINYFIFSFCFIVFHAIAYLIAGALTLKISKEVYESKSRIMDYMRDMSVEKEKSIVAKRFFPAQLLRGFLMSIILYPLLIPLGELDFFIRFAFFTGIMFIFTHIACAAPCPDNIEGFVYMKNQYFKRSSFLKFQFEMILYSLMFGILISWIFFELL